MGGRPGGGVKTRRPRWQAQDGAGVQGRGGTCRSGDSSIKEETAPCVCVRVRVCVCVCVWRMVGAGCLVVGGTGGCQRWDRRRLQHAL